MLIKGVVPVNRDKKMASNNEVEVSLHNVCLVVNAQGFNLPSYGIRSLVLKEMAITDTTWHQLNTCIYRFLSPVPKTYMTAEDKASVEREQVKNHLLYEDSKVKCGDLHPRQACSTIKSHYLLSKRTGKNCIGYSDDFTKALLEGRLFDQGIERSLLSDIPKIDLRTEEVKTGKSVAEVTSEVTLKPCSLHLCFNDSPIKCSAVNSIREAMYVKKLTQISDLTCSFDKMSTTDEA